MAFKQNTNMVRFFFLFNLWPTYAMFFRMFEWIFISLVFNFNWVLLVYYSDQYTAFYVKMTSDSSAL